MSPREKHIPDNAQRTSICLTAEDRAALRWINEARRIKKDRRTTANDILVDALWYLLQKHYGKTREQIRQMVPEPPPMEQLRSKVTEMPRPRRKR